MWTWPKTNGIPTFLPASESRLPLWTAPTPLHLYSIYLFPSTHSNSSLTGSSTSSPALLLYLLFTTLTLSHLDRLNWGSYEQPNFLFIFSLQFYVIHVSGSYLLMLVLMYCNFQVMKLKWFPLVLCKSLTWCLHVSTRWRAVFVYAWKL